MKVRLYCFGSHSVYLHLLDDNYLFGQNMTEYNPPPSPSGHPLLSGPPTLNDIYQMLA